MIMKCTYWMIIYLMECLKMIVCLRGIIGINLTKGKNNYIMIGIGMGLSFVAAWCFPQQIDPIVILLLFITNVVIFGKVIYGFLAVFSVGIFDAVLSYAIIIIFQLDFDKMYVSELFSNVEEAVSLCLLVVIALCRQRVRKENDPYQFQDLLLYGHYFNRNHSMCKSSCHSRITKLGFHENQDMVFVGHYLIGTWHFGADF